MKATSGKEIYISNSVVHTLSNSQGWSSTNNIIIKLGYVDKCIWTCVLVHLTERYKLGCICILHMLSLSVNFSLATSQGEAHVLLGHCNFANKMDHIYRRMK